MQSAVKRFEDTLALKEKERLEDADRFRQQLEENSHYQEDLEIKRKRAQMENKRMLLEQMKKESYRRLKEKLVDKEKVNTNFGPEENEQILRERQQFVKKNLDDIKASLENQMSLKYQLQEQEKMQQRLEDLEAIALAKKIMQKERSEYENKEAESKNVYKEAWKEQMKMKEIHKKTDELFKN